MYQTTVKIHNNVDNKETMKLISPIFIWAVACFLFLGLMSVTVIAVPLFFLSALSIIPITIVLFKKGKKIRNNREATKKAVTFVARDGNLYLDDMKLYVYEDYEEDEINVTDFEFEKHPTSKFWVIINKEENEAFRNFLEAYEIKTLEYVGE